MKTVRYRYYLPKGIGWGGVPIDHEYEIMEEMTDYELKHEKEIIMEKILTRHQLSTLQIFNIRMLKVGEYGGKK